MRIVLGDVTVTNWSKDPLLTLSNTQQRKLTGAISLSRQMSALALRLLRGYERKLIVKSVDPQMAKDFFASGEVVKEALERYFGITKAMATFTTDLNTIIAKLTTTEAGLKNPFQIVVGNICDLDDIKDGIRDAFLELKQGEFRSALAELKYIRTGTRGWVGPPTNALQRIHLNVNMVDKDAEDRIARTIIHEATHKFAGTDDIAYKADNLKHNAGGHANLTNNADSYAWCCRRIWKNN